MSTKLLPKYIWEWHDYVKKKPKNHNLRIKQLVKYVEKVLCKKEVFYDEMATEKFLNYCRFFRHKEGRWAGEIFEPDMLQKYIAACVFGVKIYDAEIKQEVRYFKELVVFVARKWGKSTFISAINNYMLMADGENAAQVWTLATTKSQAAIVYESSKSFLKTSSVLTPSENPRKHWRTKRDKDNSEMLLFPKTNSFMKAGSKNSESQDGLNPHCYSIDELHAIKNRNTYDVFSSATGARAQALGVIISTFGFFRDGIFDSVKTRCESVLDGKSTERLLPLIFTLDENDKVEDEKCWIKSNPALGSHPTIGYLKDEYQKALKDDDMMPSFLAKHLNIAVNASSAFFKEPKYINACAATITEEMYRGKYAVGGVDLSETTDLTCATALIPLGEKFIILQHYFMAQARIDECAKRDKQAYHKFETTFAIDGVHKQLLTICPGSTVRKTDVTRWFMDLENNYGLIFWKIGYDRALAPDWVHDMVSNGYPEERKDGEAMVGILQRIAMGPFSLSEPMRETKAMFKDKAFIYSKHNGLLRWCLNNTAAKLNTNMLIQPDKMRSNGRIDGYVALLCAYVAYKSCEMHFKNFQTA